MLRPTKPELPSHDSMFEEAAHRHSQVVKTPHHPRDQDGESNQLLQTSPTQEEQGALRDARQSPSKTVGEWTQDEWLDLARVGGLLPLAPDNSPWLNTANLTLEQQAENSSRDFRLAQLEKRQHLLSIVFGTLLASTAVLCTFIVRSETGRQEQVIAQLQKTQTEQRSVQAQERGRLISRISALDARIATLVPKEVVTPRPETPALNTAAAAPAQKAQASIPPPSTTRAAPEPAASKDEPEPAASKIEPEPAASKDEPEPATSKDAPEPATSKEAPTTPNLRDAIKSAVSKEAPQPTKPAESRPTARLACDKNDPLCGDLS